jgi:hypothetical protein
LLELLIVMVIIGVLIGFILVVATDGVRSASIRATQALITKLNDAVADRMAALMMTRVDATPSHERMGAIDNGSGTLIYSVQRAQVIALYDYLRAEMPDVFIVQAINLGTTDYPLNFAAPPFPANGAGNLAFRLPLDSFNSTPVTGMYGASFTAAGALTKLLGYVPQGYNGVDDNKDGLIDDWTEGTTVLNADGSTNTAATTALQNALLAKLAKHQHATARSEMLYALLVEGQGPLGSAFNADDFTSAEVQDTDGDGLPEFVDPWGQPLRFYRWPILYSDDSQVGVGAYSVFQARDQDNLDPNQTLVAPAWWSSTPNSGTPYEGIGPYAPVGMSARATAFTTYFHTLVDPNWSATAVTGTLWDRGTPGVNTPDVTGRRAYKSRFLIISAGPDKVLGVSEQPGPDSAINFFSLVAEGFAAPQTTDPAGVDASLNPALDDISNHTLQAPGGSLQ